MNRNVPFPVPAGEDSSDKRFLRIPTALCELVAISRWYGEFALYLYLKSVCDGRMSVDKSVFVAASKALNVSERTICRRFKELEARNWVGRMNSGRYIIRGFTKLRKMENLPSREAVYFDIRELRQLTVFVRSACICHLAKKQKNRLRRERLSEEKKGTSFARNQPLPTSFKIACKALAQIYNISIGSAFTWKQKAHQAGYLNIIHVLRPVMIDNLPEWKRVFPEQARRLVIRDNKYFLQEPDKIEPKISFCRLRSCQPKKKACDKN